MTGKGFGDTFAIVERHRPRLVILDNVVGLLEQPGEDDPEEDADADWIVEQFVSIGYWAAWFRFDAREYGSFVVRERIYCIAVLHVDSANVSSFAHDVLCGLKHEPLSVWQFLPEDPVRARRVSQGIRMPSMQAKQRGSDAANVRDEQFELCRVARLPWPVDRDQFDDAYDRLPSPHRRPGL